MIFVILGTQDKQFVRILDVLESVCKEGKIKDKIVVQAGHTKYKSNNMEILDYIPYEDFDRYIEKADIIVTHGGVGSIVNAVKLNKKVIAVARLKKYGEHTNDHQEQIVSKLANEGYILEATDESTLFDKIINIDKFTPKKYICNSDIFVKNIEEQIDKLLE